MPDNPRGNPVRSVHFPPAPSPKNLNYQRAMASDRFWQFADMPDSPVNMRVISQLALAAGVIPTITAPGGFVWEIYWCGGDLATDAVAGDRYAFVHVFNGAFNAGGGPNSIARFAGPFSQGPQELWSHMFSPGVTTYEPMPGLRTSSVSIPRIILLPGWTAALNVINFDPGDLWTAAQWTIIEMQAPPSFYEWEG